MPGQGTVTQVPAPGFHRDKLAAAHIVMRSDRVAALVARLVIAGLGRFDSHAVVSHSGKLTPLSLHVNYCPKVVVPQQVSTIVRS